MKEKSLEHVTESELLSLVKKISVAGYETDRQHDNAVLEFEALSE
jgi:hypothetical protein